jgi:hypothetical protein
LITFFLKLWPSNFNYFLSSLKLVSLTSPTHSYSLTHFSLSHYQILILNLLIGSTNMLTLSLSNSIFLDRKSTRLNSSHHVVAE